MPRNFINILKGYMTMENNYEKKLRSYIHEIAKIFGIDEEKIESYEIGHFIREHGGHGGARLELTIKEDGNLELMCLTCFADKLVDMTRCPHHNPETPVEERSSWIYSRRRILEIDHQREKRGTQPKD